MIPPASYQDAAADKFEGMLVSLLGLEVVVSVMA